MDEYVHPAHTLYCSWTLAVSCHARNQAWYPQNAVVWAVFRNTVIITSNKQCGRLWRWTVGNRPWHPKYFQVLKELSTKRVGFDKVAFGQMTIDLLPVICRAWDAQWAVIEGMLGNLSAQLTTGGGNVLAQGSSTEAAIAFSLATLCVKVKTGIECCTRPIAEYASTRFVMILQENKKEHKQKKPQKYVPYLSTCCVLLPGWTVSSKCMTMTHRKRLAFFFFFFDGTSPSQL